MKMTKLKVMTYNVQWFSGINNQLAMQEKIVSKYHAPIICLQELTTTGKISSVGKTALADYKYQYQSDHKNYLGIASQYKLKNVRSRDFRHQDPEDMERYGETRAYMTAVLEIDGKRIKLINTHLCFRTPEVKYQQMREIFSSAKRAEYAIITGDFNYFVEYEEMYKQFADAGFHLANCGTKAVKTWTEKANPKRLSQFTYPTDNIITSGNIRIKKAMFDRTKLKYENGDPVDHIPVVARLYIK